jgi:hypothetical protein
VANDYIKAEKVVNTMLGQLERELVIPNLVTRNGAEDFTGAKNDTVTLRVPAFATARSRDLRAAGPITIDDLDETKVDIVLAKDIYKGTNVTDENMTLDIENFATQVSNPVLRSIARGLEDNTAAAITGATYQFSEAVNEDDPYLGAVQARKALNDANVPMGGRAMLVGSAIEAAFLSSDRFARVDASGTDSALREAQIGRVAGFDVFTSNAIDEEAGYAFHRTAFVLVSRAPLVPDGVSWGMTSSFEGFAIRTIKDYDPLNLRDRFIANCYIGSNVVTDYGAIVDGKFVPDETPDLENDTPIMVRAVELTLGS